MRIVPTHRNAADEEDEEDDHRIFSALSSCEIDNENDQNSSK